jgi:hypothetical protein
VRRFTVSIDDDLLIAAKQKALERGVTMSSLVRDLLAREVRPTKAELSVLSDKDEEMTILRYSHGEMSLRQAMQALSMHPDQYLEFLEMIGRHFASSRQSDDNAPNDRSHLSTVRRKAAPFGRGGALYPSRYSADLRPSLQKFAA